jgi:carbonic anhydrase/acetyltransferase-like protein (isoleucine patch superfamily)
MGAVLLNGSKVGAGSIVAAAALVTENSVIPPACLAMGVPAKVVRSLSAEEIESIRHNALDYIQLAREAGGD